MTDANDLTVQYTNSDDGIWLTCGDCAQRSDEYVMNLGHFPTIWEIKNAAERHIAEKHECETCKGLGFTTDIGPLTGATIHTSCPDCPAGETRAQTLP
jgi:hypothetical protein